MFDQQLVSSFMREQIAKGESRESIISVLKTKGLTDVEISQAFLQVPNPQSGNENFFTPEVKPKTTIIFISLLALLMIVVGVLYFVFKDKIFSINNPASNTEDKQNQVVETPADKQTADKSGFKTYTDPLGLFNFSYPLDWVIYEVEGTNETSGLVVFSDIDEKSLPNFNVRNLKHTFSVYTIDQDPTIDLKSEMINNDYTEEELMISGIVSKKFVRIFGVQSIVAYVVPLKLDDLEKFLVVGAVLADDKKDWLPKVDDVIGTMVINQSKLQATVNQNDLNEMDVDLKVALSNMRPSAEIYKDSHPDFIGFCNTGEEPAHTNLIKLKSILGDQPYRCTDGPSFAMSIQLYNGKYYCTDSTYYYGETSSLHTSNVCR